MSSTFYLYSAAVSRGDVILLPVFRQALAVSGHCNGRHRKLQPAERNLTIDLNKIV